MSTKTRSALRATLKQEDAALEERLPEPSPPAATQPETAPLAATADTPVPPATADADAGAQAPVAPASTAPTPIAPATPVAPTAPAKPGAQAKAEKRTAERFKLTASDRRRIGALRDDLKAAGRRTSKSELVRAGLAALVAQRTAEVMALVDLLSPSTRAEDRKARRAKAGKAGPKRKGKGKPAARKR